MITLFYKSFLNDFGEYRASEKHWEDLWKQSGSTPDWICPWASTGAPDCLDGNPIFSAYSPLVRRAVRIIQHEPTTDNVEIRAWPNFAGGSVFDPEAYRELVIACALSDVSSQYALSLIRPWVTGESLYLDIYGGSMNPRSPLLVDLPFEAISLSSAA